MLSFAACSLYQSDSRKFLEKQAFEYDAASAYLVSCPIEPIASEWEVSAETESAKIFENQKIDFAIRILPSQQEGQFSCIYRFTSAQEMIEKMDAAIELTRVYMGLSPGAFAFHPDSHLK